MSAQDGIDFIEDVCKTTVPVTDETYARLLPLDVNITLAHLLGLMRDADLQKRRVFYGQEIRQSTSAEWEALTQVFSQLSPLPDDTHSKGKGVFATPLPALTNMPEDVRKLLDNMVNRYHSVLGLLSEVAELAVADTLVLRQVLTYLYTDPTGADFYETVEDVQDSIKNVKENINRKHNLPPHEHKNPEDVQYEEIADMLFYLAQHLSTCTARTVHPVSLPDLCSAVVAKLKERYPGQFSLANSENHTRDKFKEMKAFTGTLVPRIQSNLAYIANKKAFVD